MQFNRQYLERIRDSIRSNPLGMDELRKIEDLGGQFVALSSTSIDKKVCSRSSEIEIDNVFYTIYNCVADAAKSA